MPIQLPPERYWEARARQADAKLALWDLQEAAKAHWRDDDEILARLRERFETAQARAQAVTERLGDEFGMAIGVRYRWDDDTHTLRETAS